jgi:two-component system, OmpR family, response regulator MprA
MLGSVLIVDDSPEVRRLLRVHLERRGVAVDDAVDGVDGLEEASGSCPDLIVLDMSMPRMNGLDAAPRPSQICPNVPILLHTLHADLIGQNLKLPVGVTEIIDKGENLIARVLKLLGRADGQGAPTQQNDGVDP